MSGLEGLSSRTEVGGEVVFYSADRRLQNLLMAALQSDYKVKLESSRDQLKQIAARGQADAIILDCDSNESSLERHLALYEDIEESASPIIVLTDDAARATTTAFLQRGAFDCIRRPPSLIELKVLISRARDHAQMKRDLAAMKRAADRGIGCDQMVGSSGKAQVVYDLIGRVADLSAFVLIQGESGTGKELVARAIHNLGNRAEEPFVAVSCGAIPETLIESELFGHEKGAFTGSTGPREGYLEQAGGGTLFLDEIGELSLSTQVKLLRVLQQREFSRLGGNRPIPLNARVVFATHRNLEQMIEEGAFRRDLYFRVNVVKINVPPLRERTEDIPTLARHFLRKYAEEYRKQITDIRPSAMEALVEYDWPGNIRELENVIQGAVVLADGDSVGRADLPAHLQMLDEAVIDETGSSSDRFDELVRQFKVSLASKTIVECGGNKSLAARKLKISRAYIHRLIQASPDALSEEDIAMAS